MSLVAVREKAHRGREVSVPALTHLRRPVLLPPISISRPFLWNSSELLFGKSPGLPNVNWSLGHRDRFAPRGCWLHERRNEWRRSILVFQFSGLVEELFPPLDIVPQNF